MCASSGPSSITDRDPSQDVETGAVRVCIEMDIRDEVAALKAENIVSTGTHIVILGPGSRIDAGRDCPSCH